MHPGWIGGIIGGIIGLAGGIIGTWFSIKNTKGPAEKAFMIRMAVYIWILLLLFLLLLLWLPRPYNFLVWIPYSIILPFGIRYINKRQLEIQQSEKKL